MARRLARAHVDVVAVEGDVELAERDLGALELGDPAAQPLRDRAPRACGCRRARPARGRGCPRRSRARSASACARSPRHRGQSSLQRSARSGRAQGVLTFDSFPASRDRVKGVRCRRGTLPARADGVEIVLGDRKKHVDLVEPAVELDARSRPVAPRPRSLDQRVEGGRDPLVDRGRVAAEPSPQVGAARDRGRLQPEGGRVVALPDLRADAVLARRRRRTSRRTSAREARPALRAAPSPWPSRAARRRSAGT